MFTNRAVSYARCPEYRFYYRLLHLPFTRTPRSELPAAFFPAIISAHFSTSIESPRSDTTDLESDYNYAGEDELDTEENSTMSTGSRKRKLDESAPSKYYAVKAGHKPGVYRSWADCQKNTTGFQGAMCKSMAVNLDQRANERGR